MSRINHEQLIDDIINNKYERKLQYYKYIIEDLQILSKRYYETTIKNINELDISTNNAIQILKLYQTLIKNTHREKEDLKESIWHEINFYIDIIEKILSEQLENPYKKIINKVIEVNNLLLVNNKFINISDEYIIKLKEKRKNILNYRFIESRNKIITSLIIISSVMSKNEHEIFKSNEYGYGYR